MRLVTGQKAALATGGEDGSEILQEKAPETWGGKLGESTNFFRQRKWLVSRGFKLMEINSNGCFSRWLNNNNMVFCMSASL